MFLVECRSEESLDFNDLVSNVRFVSISPAYIAIENYCRVSEYWIIGDTSWGPFFFFLFIYLFFKISTSIL